MFSSLAYINKVIENNSTHFLTLENWHFKIMLPIFHEYPPILSALIGKYCLLTSTQDFKKTWIQSVFVVFENWHVIEPETLGDKELSRDHPVRLLVRQGKQEKSFFKFLTECVDICLPWVCSSSCPLGAALAHLAAISVLWPHLMYYTGGPDWTLLIRIYHPRGAVASTFLNS